MRRRSNVEVEIIGEVTPLLHKTKPEPQDQNRLVYLVFYYIGVTILLPYSMIITLSEYWMYKFRNTTAPPDPFSNQTLTELQKHFPGYLSITGNVPCAVFVVLTAICGGKFNLKTRLISSGLVEVAAFCSFTLLSALDTDSWQDTLLVLVLLTNTLYSSVNAIFQASFLGNIGRFPPRYIGSANDGMGLGATLPAVISLAILGLDPPTEYTGLACIGFALTVLVVMLPLYHVASTTPFYRHHSGHETGNTSQTGFRECLSVMWRCRVFVLTVYYNFTLTLAVYPAVAALVKPVSSEPSDWNNKYFVVVSCFLLQSVCDWMGRSLATFSQWPRPGRPAEIGLVFAVILRTGFVPMIMFCNIAPQNRINEVVFDSDFAYIGLMAGFSLMGGYIGNTALMLGPKSVSQERQELVSSLLISALVLGLGTGSLIGPVLVTLL